MIKKKHSQIVFVIITAFGMSIIMSLVIIYINMGIDSEFLISWDKAWLVAFLIAIIAVIIVVPLAKKITNKIAY